MRRDLGHAAPDTPAARKKARIAGGIIGVAVVIDLVASLMIANGGPRDLSRLLIVAGCALLLVGIVYMFVNRRAS